MKIFEFEKHALPDSEVQMSLMWLKHINTTMFLYQNKWKEKWCHWERWNGMEDAAYHHMYI